MELQDFIAKFAQQFDDTDESEITAETVYSDLDEWSSLTTLSIIAFIKTEYGKSITGKEIRTCSTVLDLFNFVSSL
ncbi:acyl carrier protein [Segatella paludivivens]|uniref:acyl carrier protein n=1 Tax=Segatella paludivivens TaxID=185294 RepID=UPI00037B2353|nr:acyl carrier protein [Segatella paludivivens]